MSERDGSGETNFAYADVLQQESYRFRAEDAVLKDEPQFLAWVIARYVEPDAHSRPYRTVGGVGFRSDEILSTETSQWPILAQSELQS